jgi:hypothetical protein
MELRLRGALLLFGGALLLASCGMNGAPGRSTPQLPASANTAEPAGSQSFTIAIDVPTPGPTIAPSSTTRRPSYISYSSRSVVFTLDEPSAQQTALQHRTIEKDIVPGPNAITLAAPPGDIMLSGSIHDEAGGAGYELSYASPIPITISVNAASTVTMTFDPVVYAAYWEELSLSSFFFFNNEATGGGACYGFAGTLYVGAVDADGNKILGAGHFIDKNHSPVTITAIGGKGHDPDGTDFTAGGVSVFIGSQNAATTTPLTGSFRESQNLGALSSTSIYYPEIKATGSSSAVASYAGAVNADPANYPQCNPGGGG